jgi:hypothetical protein
MPPKQQGSSSKVKEDKVGEQSAISRDLYDFSRISPYDRPLG